MENESCFVCRKHSGDVPVPGGAIYEDDLVFICHAGLFSEEAEHYLGHLFIETRRHVPDLTGLSDEESAAIGLWIGRLSRALKDALGVEHVYAFSIGDGVPHVHVHVIGRYPGAPEEYWGPKVDEWPDAPHGGVQALAETAVKIREALADV